MQPPNWEQELAKTNMEFCGLKHTTGGRSSIAGEILCLAFYLLQCSGSHKNKVVSSDGMESDSEFSTIFDDAR